MQHVSHHSHHFYETELGDVTAGSTVNALRVSHSSCQSLKERHWYTNMAARLISQIKWCPTEVLPEVSRNHSLIESRLINIKDVRHTGKCRSENDKKNTITIFKLPPFSETQFWVRRVTDYHAIAKLLHWICVSKFPSNETKDQSGGWQCDANCFNTPCWKNLLRRVLHVFFAFYIATLTVINK
jgi:hypothetical protein